MSKEIVRIGNAQAFWGDDPSAPSRLVAQQPNLDYLTLDYLAEVSLSIMAMQKLKNPQIGYAQDFLEVIKSLIPFWKKGYPFKLITNAGGLNPRECANACIDILKAHQCSLKVGVVEGDDVTERVLKSNNPDQFSHLDTQLPIDRILPLVVSANAYFGADPIVEALDKGAQIVITGRVADPSLTVGPCIHHFHWSKDEWDKIAGATVAGHLIECGTQATGGIFTQWLSVPDPAHIGFPIAEVSANGDCVITKPENTGGLVTEEVIKEQLLYEIGDPENYISPDATVSFTHLKVEQEGINRVKISQAKGRPSTNYYKVSTSYNAGYKTEAMLTIFGPHAAQKAYRSGEIILERVRLAGYELKHYHVECLGNLDVAEGVLASEAPKDLKECVLRICAIDTKKEALEYLTKQIAPLVTSGAQGTTGYISGRPKVRPVFGFWPCLIEKSLVTPHIEILEG
jgi:Acyclic terpene utilisation family protein AtuA